MRSTRNRAIRASVTTILAAAAVTASLVEGNPAFADGQVSSCAGSGDPSSNTCIVVWTASKNTTNQTQYVSQIRVNAPTSWAPNGLLEAWAGDGPTGVAWYASQYTTTQTWTINKWIKNGSGVCGAYGASGSRSVACITIKV
jgi:hypothetical protein